MPRPAPQDALRFVLVRPGSSGNVGAAARALKNTGFSSLWLVEPRDLEGREAERLAHGAGDVLRGARRVGTLAEALAGCRWVVGTTRRVGRRRAPAWSPRALAAAVHREPRRRPLALVFGPEEDGLGAAELRLCHDLVRIPAAPAQPSYNLAQAVLVLAYEIHVHGREEAGLEAPAAGPEATVEQLEAMYEHLEAMLLQVGFLRRDTAPARMLALRRILGRARLRPGDVRLVRGICRQVDWAVRASRPAGLARHGRRES
jgi:TrmH family RNA methyltransferase